MRISPSLDFVQSGSPSVSVNVPLKTTLFSKFTTMLQSRWRALAIAFNGNIGFGDGTNSDNISGSWRIVTFPVANADVLIPHNLGRVPVGYIVMSKSQAGDIYTGSTTPTNTQINLRCTTAGTTASLFLV